jgi:hypothetical protein
MQNCANVENEVGRPKFNAPWVLMTCYRKDLPVGFFKSSSLDYILSSAYLQNNMYTNHNNKNRM